MRTAIVLCALVALAGVASADVVMFDSSGLAPGFSIEQGLSEVTYNGAPALECQSFGWHWSGVQNTGGADITGMTGIQYTATYVDEGRVQGHVLYTPGNTWGSYPDKYGFEDVLLDGVAINRWDVWITPGEHVSYKDISDAGSADWFAVAETNFGGLNWQSCDMMTYYITDMRLVPEPATMSILGLGALALIRRRR